MKLYLAGPINGHLDFYEQFQADEELLIKYGYQVVNPTKIDNSDHEAKWCWINHWGKQTKYPDMQKLGLHTWECYMKYDLAELLFCDGVALREGWEKSSGAKMEYSIALQLQIACLDIQMWVENGWRYNTAIPRPKEDLMKLSQPRG